MVSVAVILLVMLTVADDVNDNGDVLRGFMITLHLIYSGQTTFYTYLCKCIICAAPLKLKKVPGLWLGKCCFC